ncbi:hypothetical protein [Streptomyces olivaceiscleroticus]|uniref:Uncharacterized protein n=1 Tax=Streptomyces olivaceiscleroticus TaxID=68245 RepID=A0ABN1BMN2_9ACTN
METVPDTTLDLADDLTGFDRDIDAIIRHFISLNARKNELTAEQIGGLHTLLFGEDSLTHLMAMILTDLRTTDAIQALPTERQASLKRHAEAMALELAHSDLHRLASECVADTDLDATLETA